MRTGSEPSEARSPLRLRLGLAILGLVSAVAGALAFVLAGFAAGVVGCVLLGLVALVDLAVIVRRIRQGPHFQPGRTVPPYRPVVPRPEERRRQPRGRRPLAVRRRAYLYLMALCLTLFVLAWTWVRLFSPAAAVLMSGVAAVIPPLAVILANAGAGSGPPGRNQPR